ncbi:MAG: hypothetical protein Aurels2KO_17490 [Aureliella sp.]
MAAAKRTMPLLDWQRVRRLSQLTLLNRIVLTMLVVVPLVVAVWPNYQMTVDRYHKTVDLARGRLTVGPTESKLLGDSIGPTGSADQERAEPVTDEGTPIDTAAEAIQPSGQRAPIADVGGWIRAWGVNVPLLETRVEAAVIERAATSRQARTIPRTWALAFIAALCILAGDTIQQIFCPAIIRRESLDEFVERRLQVYATSPSSLLLEQAVQETLAGADQDDGDTDSDSHTTASDQQQLGIVHLASRETYQELSRRGRPAILGCYLCYSAGASILIKILQEQTLNVLAAAGWIS